MDYIYLSPYQSIRAGNNWYRNIQFLGKGGNGTTFLVTCTGGKYKGEIFAIKIFHKISSEKRKKRFLEEIEFMKKQNHPSVMMQFDEGQFKDKPFVIVQYLPYTLMDEISKGSISIGKGLVYSLQLLSAVKHLSELNVVHRDIKPQNIFINNLSAILGDFGLIKKLDLDESEELSEVREYLAMPRFYRTPELIEYAKGKAKLRLETDIFQLGLVMACMFTGRNPLKHSEDSLSDIVLDEIQFISGVYGPPIKKIIHNMLIINPGKRWSLDHALDAFNGIFEQYSKRKMTIDGQLFD